MKILYVILGTLSLILGIIGIIVPGLPTTPFILLTGYFYFKSSEKLYYWLLNQKYLGKYIRNYKQKGAFSKRTLVYAMILMWVMISASVIFLIKERNIQIIIFVIGIIGTVVMSLLKTHNE